MVFETTAYPIPPLRLTRGQYRPIRLRRQVFSAASYGETPGTETRSTVGCGDPAVQRLMARRVATRRSQIPAEIGIRCSVTEISLQLVW